MEILIIVLLTLLNSFFSLSEIALVSVKKSRIQNLADQGNHRAIMVLKLLESPENFLSSVQVGITLIGIVSGAYGGANLTDDLESVLIGFTFLGEYVHIVSLITVIGAITFFTIVIGELVPKTIAMNNAESISLICVPIIKYFTLVTYPFVKLLSISTKVILKLLGSNDNSSDHVSEEELKYLLIHAEKTGVLESDESQVHQNVFSFADQTAKSLLTPVFDVEWINLEKSKEELFNQIVQSNHSKIIVCQSNTDDVVGYIRTKDFFENHKNPDFKLESIVQETLYMTQNTPAFKILDLFRKKKQYLATIMDEYGRFLGIITLHDLIEGIVGDLPEEDEEVIEKIKSRDHNSFFVEGRTNIAEFNAYFQDQIIELDFNKYTTVAGFILNTLQKLPEPGDSVVQGFYTFEVVDIDNRRIDKLIVHRLEKDEL